MRRCSVPGFFRARWEFSLPFSEVWIPSGHFTINAWLAECCTDGCCSLRFSSLHKRVTVVFLLACKTRTEDDWWLQNLKMIWGYRGLWHFHCCRNMMSFSRSVPFHNPVKPVEFSHPQLFVFILIHPFHYGTLYRAVSTLANYVNEIENFILISLIF